MTSWRNLKPEKIEIIFTDIDGTLTTDGRISSEVYQALWQLNQAGKKIIPVTGRPAGWCDAIARLWPVHGVIGENGGLVYRYDGRKMKRHEFISPKVRREYRLKLKTIAQEVRQQIPAARISADQFCRRFDLAIDFAEDISPPLPEKDIQRIKSIFEKYGATAKISNIHVNGWFGDYDKLSACLWYCKKHLDFNLNEHQHRVAFVGDSPNDEPMFGFFKNSFAVANVKDFLKQMKSHPTYIATATEGAGFVELARRLLRLG